MAIKRGDYFTHRYYFTEDGAGKRPLRCKVTKVAKGLVYYRGVYSEPGSPELLGAVYYSTIEDMADRAALATL